MKTSPLYPSTMRAAIDPAAIRKVNRFFNATSWARSRRP